MLVLWLLQSCIPALFVGTAIATYPLGMLTVTFALASRGFGFLTRLINAAQRDNADLADAHQLVRDHLSAKKRLGEQRSLAAQAKTDDQLNPSYRPRRLRKNQHEIRLTSKQGIN